MCWPSGDAESPQQQTTPRRMDDMIRCPINIDRCDESHRDHCLNEGICCLINKKPFCVCPRTHRGSVCEDGIFEESRLIMERAKAIAAVSAVLGAFVIIMFIALVALQIKYYRRRRRRIIENDHEMDVIKKPKPHPDGGCRINQPGYSWRESVRRPSKAYQTLRGPSSRSVPDDLFKMGVTIALFNWKAIEQKNEGRGGERGGRGGGNTAGFGPKATHSPTVKDNGQERVPLTRTEDTVDK